MTGATHGRGGRTGRGWHRAIPRAALLALAAAPLAAQQPDSARRAAALNPVVTTATRDARALREVPAATSVVDSTALARSRTVHLGDALRAVPGIQAGTLYGTEDVKITARGAGVRSGFGVRGVAVLLDGIPLTEPDGQGRLDLIDLGTAQRVEVVRGPVSALYGGAAGGGAVNVVTRGGRDAPGWQLRALAGDFGTRRYDGTWGQAGAEADLLVSASYTGLEGYRDVSQGTTRRARVLARFGDASATRYTLDLAWSLLDQRIPGALTQAEWDAGAQQAESTNVANRFRRFEERWRLAARAQRGVAGGALDVWAVYTGRANTQSIVQYISQAQQRLQGGVLFARGWEGTPLAPRLTMGIDGDRARGPQTNYTNANGKPRYSPPCTNDRINGVFAPACVDQFADAAAVGAFAQLELTRGAFTLTAGLRSDAITYDISNEIRPSQALHRTFDQVSPKVALRWRVRPALTAYVAVARGFDVPTATELSISPDTIRNFNDALGAASQWSYELGARGTLGSRATFDVALYRAIVEGDFVSRTVAIPGAPVPRSIFENAGRVRRTGLEVAGTLLLAPWLEARGTYTYSDHVFEAYLTTITGPAYTAVGFDAAGLRVPGIARHRAVLELRATPTERLGLSLWGEGMGGIPVDVTNASSGIVYQRTSAATAAPAGRPVPFQALTRTLVTHASGTFRLGDVTLFAQVENLMDTRWASSVTINASNGRFYYPAPPRALSVGVSARFD